MENYTYIINSNVFKNNYSSIIIYLDNLNINYEVNQKNDETYIVLYCESKDCNIIEVFLKNSNIKYHKFLGLNKKNNGKRSITMYNMGFGDCFIIAEDKSALMVDFGSKFSQKTLEGIFPNHINNIVSDFNKFPQKNLLITHFHNDHYKFTKFLNDNSLDNIFVRNIYGNKNNRNLQSFIKFNIFQLITMSKRSDQWKKAYNTINAIPNLKDKLKLNGYYNFINEGSIFNIANSIYEVLLPYNFNIDNNMEYEKNEYDNEIDYLFSIMSEVYPLAIKLLDSINNLDLGESMRVSRYEISNKQEDFDSINILINNLQESNNEINYEYKIMIKNKLKKFIDTNKEHNYNIVFREINNDILMTGDAEAVDLDKVLKKLSDAGNLKFKIVKAPHHGTKSHYFSEYNNCNIDKLLITHSKYPRYGSLTSSYNNLRTKIYCTSIRYNCDIYRKVPCNCRNCKCIKNKRTFNF